ncbi:MAG: lytic transglycosylase domain-containing protein [Pseudomonadota bacterium]
MSLLQHRNLLILSTALLLCSSVHAEVYKYVNNGITTYSAEKPERGAFESLKPSCLLSYIGCELAGSDWSRIKLNHHSFNDLIEQSARNHAVDAALIRAVIHAESNFNHQAKSKAGAEGLMQLMPATQKLLQVVNPYNARENIDGGTRLLKQLLKKYDNNIKHATAAYNAGETAVKRYRGVPPYEETQNYVKRVAQLYSRYRSLIEWTHE